MEYLAGSIFTLLCVYIVFNFITKNRSSIKPISIQHTQSKAFSSTFPFGLYNLPQPIRELKTQATEYFDKTHARIVMYQDNAYWLENENFYTAPVVEGKVDTNSKKRVDTMGMSSVELDELMVIVEKLREGSRHDGGSSRN